MTALFWQGRNVSISVPAFETGMMEHVFDRVEFLSHLQSYAEYIIRSNTRTFVQSTPQTKKRKVGRPSNGRGPGGGALGGGDDGDGDDPLEQVLCSQPQVDTSRGVLCR